MCILCAVVCVYDDCLSVGMRQRHQPKRKGIRAKRIIDKRIPFYTHIFFLFSVNFLVHPQIGLYLFLYTNITLVNGVREHIPWQGKRRRLSETSGTADTNCLCGE